ncbi:hypothetical protein, partial [Acidobacterium sp. S8]|uniref:hypothetical protein n=1 Tax=Acidobacterium sp. S8 TaxID=1641854 RepID=UPI001C207EAD
APEILSKNDGSPRTVDAALARRDNERVRLLRLRNTGRSESESGKREEPVAKKGAATKAHTNPSEQHLFTTTLAKADGY